MSNSYPRLVVMPLGGLVIAKTEEEYIALRKQQGILAGMFLGGSIVIAAISLFFILRM